MLDQAKCKRQKTRQRLRWRMSAFVRRMDESRPRALMGNLTSDRPKGGKVERLFDSILQRSLVAPFSDA
ncbi:unnamed protein product [Protopolystoma xenopodis]|uniref:Uncharacterized protein n=1 Tax=Protopolystoma xenopodis TaxID=117903 RepID=A0A448X1J9_9PLAT|nr:unnamed protein product [Protopolystoma xenopodis]